MQAAMVDHRAVVREVELIEAELSRRSLRFFVERAWSIVEPRRPFVENWHIDKLCELLTDVTFGKTKNLLINVPPGTMKSLLVSVMWPAWEWGPRGMPWLRYLAWSYGAHLSMRDNQRMRQVIEDPWYQRCFDVELSEDQNAKQYYMNTAGGWRLGTSVGGIGTGEHPDRRIIDDPHSADQARSDAERQAAIDSYDLTLGPRGVSRDPATIVIMQRLHEKDLSGHLIAKGGFTHVCWPMRYDPARPDPRDPRRDPGELLWPGLIPENKVAEVEIILGPYGAAGQLQQRPAPEGGGLFKREWFDIVDTAPAQATRCRGWDTAGTEGAGDYTAGIKIAKAGGVFYIEDVRRGQWSPATVEQQMNQAAQLDGRACRQREEQEPGSSGKAVIASRARFLAGYDYAGVSVTGDKVTRARPFRAQCEARNVKLVRGPWNDAYLAELEAFPFGANDDQVDASSAAFNELVTGDTVREVEVLW